MSFPDSINNNKAFFLLKNIATLINTGYPLPAIEDLRNPTESYIELFKEFSEKGLPNEKTDQIWKVISQILPELRNYKLDDVFLAAIRGAPGSSEESSQQAFMHLKNNQGTSLKQIYRDQLWTWMENEAHNLPSNSVLFLLSIWKDFGSVCVNQTAWDMVLSLSNRNSSQKKELENIKLNHDFIVKHYQFFQYIKLRESEIIPDNVKTPISKKTIKDIRKEYLGQYVLWAKALNALFSQVGEAYGFFPIDFMPSSWKYQLLYAPRKISSKILIWRAKKAFPIYLEKLRPFSKLFIEKLVSLREAQEIEKKSKKNYILL